MKGVGAAEVPLDAEVAMGGCRVSKKWCMWTKSRISKVYQ